MTKEQDYFKMAMDSGARPTIDNSPTQVWFSMSQLERFATLVRNAALEEAKQVCEGYPERESYIGEWIADQLACAQAIESLKEPTT